MKKCAFLIFAFCCSLAYSQERIYVKEKTYSVYGKSVPISFGSESVFYMLQLTPSQSLSKEQIRDLGTLMQKGSALSFLVEDKSSPSFTIFTTKRAMMNAYGFDYADMLMKRIAPATAYSKDSFLILEYDAQ